MAPRKAKRRKRQTAQKRARPIAESDAKNATPPPRVRIARRRTWLFRLLAVTLVPVLFFLLAEVSLRVLGYGRPAGFFVAVDGRDAYATNQQFGWRFFPPAIARTPVVCELPAEKAKGGYRIFVLGGSAAMGTPDSAFAFGRMLEVMLQERYPGVRFQVVNAAMTAVNSHVVLPIARDCVRQGADLLVVYMGNNEVVGPYGSGTIFEGFSPSLSAIRASIYVKSTRLGQLLQNAATRLAKRDQTLAEWKGMEMFLGHRIAADDPRMEKVYGHFRANLVDLCEAARASGAKVIVCTVATNLKDCAPFAAVHRVDLDAPQRAQWQRIASAGIALAKAGRHAEAVAQFRMAAEIDGRRADLHFRFGRSLLALERFDEAREHFVRARDLDVLRFRADTQINEIIREVAGERVAEGVCLVDAERAFQQSGRTPHQISGRELLYEHVHMNPEGNYLLAKVVFEQVAAVLPDSIRRRATGPAAATPEDRCFERIGLTGWDRYRLGLDVSRMEEEPPFTNRLDHAERRELWEKELEELRTQWTSPAALEDARRIYLAALDRDPQDVELRRNFAALLLERGDFEEAARQWQTLLKRFPDMAQWHVELGTVLKSQKKWAQAVTEFREAMRINPFLAPWVYFDVGTVRMDQGKLVEAAELFRRVLVLNPNLAQAHNSLGAVLLKQDRFSGAIEQFRRALQLDPKLARAHHNFGYALAKLDKLPEAVEHYRQALRLDPMHLDTYRDLASVLVKQGKMPEAIEQYRQAVRVAPQNVDVRYRLGNALAACSQTTAAADAFGKVLQMEPDHVRARHNLAVALAILGRTAGAIEQYRQVLRRRPDYLPTLDSLALILASAEDPQLRDGAEAVRLMELACERAEGADAKLLNTLSAAYAETGRFEDAAACAGRALQLAQRQGDQKLVASVRHRLLLYRAGKPYRRPAARVAR